MERKSVAGIVKRKKTLNACQWCRTRKIKCTGHQPCDYCTSRGLECTFHEPKRKIFVSEEYIRALEARCADPQQQQSPAPNTGRLTPLIATPNSLRSLNRPNGQRQPQAGGEDRSRYNDVCDYADAIGDDYRRFGHSSSFSFSRNIRLMIAETVHGPEIHDKTPIKDGAYGMPWKPMTVDLSGLNLPSEEYAEYLTQTAYFALRPLYHLFDKATFLRRLHLFYNDLKRSPSPETGLWLIQMLVIFALGTSILTRESGPRGPTGSKFFARAIEALPDCHQLSQDPVLSIEILGLIALFMQAMDMRFAAHQYIGLAVRICVANGLERRWDSRRNTREEFEHRSKLWWSIYVIDRKLSSLIGVVPAISDDDISLSKPDIDAVGGDEDRSTAFHVEIMSQLGHVLNVVYGHGLQRALGCRFVTAIQSVLLKQAETATGLNSCMKTDPQGISRTAATLYLLHHQITILAIRPITYFLLEKKLSDERSTLQLSDAVIGLLRVCTESARKILTIIESLRRRKLLDMFLPHDIDFMFAAAFILIVVDIIVPPLSESEPWDLNAVLSLLEDCIVRGIIIAGPYKKDLLEIKHLSDRMRHRQLHGEGGPDHSAHNLRSGSDIDHAASNLLSLREEAQQDHCHRTDIPQTESYWDSGLVHPETLQSAIEGLDFGFLDDLSVAETVGNDWMW
ncbi:fungal-specific transcription factor domain-containing protein [Aspergillus pseudoustus]|uniref:Fungal-specific transcription factor domain-containing protein n=1 Tax=Aspergillus pseudoustus TaxID=1810923 RepID=A0ABR4IU76_9EURO